MVPEIRNLDSVVPSDTPVGNSQAADDIFVTTSPQRGVNDSPSSPPIPSDQSPTRILDTPGASPHGQNLGHRRRSANTIGGRLAAPPRRFPVINSRRDSQRSVDRTPNRVVRRQRRMSTLGNYQRSGSFLQYISSVEDLSRAIAGVQQIGPPERGNRQPLASYPSRLLRIRRNRRVQVWRGSLNPIPDFGHDAIGQSIHTLRPRPSHPPTSRVTTPPAEPMLEPSRLSMDSLGSADSRVTEHDTQPAVRSNRPRWPGHVLYCDCVICDKLNEPFSP
ncbi:hypothetical protein FAGAP_8827 [Fusarium agapanthi]|uniref:Uncharacterized protein n=1 Tax=Fusarium agapanthi TaxID=1803897 RepID=A0A9P5BAG7_9HYPO|nr:hypothetical protein FAGAP_8827 [Fusarium agapanthi]